jgi:tRNA modification GTPase
MDTIFAPATATGKAGIAVVRISGPAADGVLKRLAGDLPAVRRASLRALRDASGEVLDEALVLRFEPGRSFTGEAVAELHVHGSVAVLDAVLGAVEATGLARPAKAGEFTRRAFDNGRLDLSQVRGLADLIDAETEAQRRAALARFDGELTRLAEEWRCRLIRATALLEAMIDFADEDVPEDTRAEVASLVGEVLPGLDAQIAGFDAARGLRQGFTIAILGAPNAGKSSLVNHFAGRDAAIVTAVPGTTRDVIEVRVDLDGLPVTFLDTAGLREAVDPVERIGVERARARAEQADLRIGLDGGDGLPVEVASCDIVLRSQVDRRGGDGISVVSGQGLIDLRSRIVGLLRERVDGASLIARQQELDDLRKAKLHLSEAVESLYVGPVEVSAHRLRAGLRHLEHLLGRVDVEDVLDVVFASFCLGK